MRTPRLSLLVGSIGICALLAAPARADIQKPGHGQVFPGKFEFSFAPIGVAAQFNHLGPVGGLAGYAGGFKMAFDFSGRIAEAGPLRISLGGGFNPSFFPNYGGGGVSCDGFGNCYSVAGSTTYFDDIQFWIFTHLSMEKLVTNVPIVPYVRVGLFADALTYSGPFASSRASGAFGLRFGGGFRYYLLKSFGLGAEMDLSFGAGNVGGPFSAAFYGTWDLLFGGTYAF